MYFSDPISFVNDCLSSAASAFVVTSVDAVYFDGSSKPLERNTWKAGKAGEMSLSFKTSEKRGILIYQGGHEGNGHFFSLGLDKGVVQLVVSLGGDNLKFADTVPTNDCEWHRVEVIRDGKGSGDLMVDERKVALSFNDQEGNFHMNGSFLVGGVTSETKDFVLELFGSSYIGCMGGISLLGEPISLSEGDRIGCPDDFNCQSSVITESGEGPCPSDDDDCHSGSGETDEPVTVSTHTTTGSPSVKIITSRMPKTTEPPNLPESPCDEDDEDCPTMSGSGTDESSFAPGTDEPSFASGTDEPSVTTDEPSVTSRPPMPVVFTKGGNIIYKPDDPVQMPNPLEVKLKFSTQQIMASIMYFKVSESEGLQVYLKEGRVTLKYFENIKGRNRRQASPDTSVFLTGKVNDGKPHYISSSISGSTVVTSLDGGKEMVVNHGFSMPSTYESINVGGSSVPQMPGFQGQMESAKAGDMDILAEAAGDNQNVIVNGPVRFVGSVPTPTQKTTTASSKPGKVMTPKPTVTDKSETPSREATTSPEASTTKAGADGTFVIERTTPPQTTTDKDINFPVADSGSSGISGGVVAGVILGVVIAVLVVTALLVFVIMRYQRKDEGSYTLDEQSPSKNGFPNSTKAQEAGMGNQEWYM